MEIEGLVDGHMQKKHVPGRGLSTHTGVEVPVGAVAGEAVTGLNQMVEEAGGPMSW